MSFDLRPLATLLVEVRDVIVAPVHAAVQLPALLLVLREDHALRAARLDEPGPLVHLDSHTVWHIFVQRYS